MTRYLKALGLSLLAVFAMSAVAASGAQAQAEFTGREDGTPVHTILDGTSESLQDFNYPTFIGTAHLECQHADFDGTSLDGTDSELTIKAAYYGNEADPTNPNETCEANSPLGSDVAHVDLNECDYTFHAGNEIAAEEFTGTVDVKCAEGHEIDVKVTNSSEGTKCTIQIPGDETGAEPTNQGLEHVIYKNEETAEGDEAVTIEADVEGITYTTTGGLFNCGKSNGLHHDSSYEGNATVTGENTEGGPVDVTLSEE